jgi:hypothetical protein
VRRRTAAVLARYSERAREAIWQAWLRHPDDERWELLTRCRGERALADAVLAAVIDPAGSATARSVIGAFCVRRGIVPGEDAERALFYLMAGQPSGSATPMVTHLAAGRDMAKACQFAPDGSEMLVSWRREGRRHGVKLILARASFGDAGEHTKM